MLEGGPELGGGCIAERLARFRDFYDHYRTAIVNEPRGADVLVGALLCAPNDPTCAAGVIFFNNVGYLGMCGHGTIGLVTTLHYLGRIGAGRHRIETPVGEVIVELYDDGHATVTNVPSYRWAAGIKVDVPGYGQVTGDVAWGGNWFFLVQEHGLEVSLENVETLTEFAWRVRGALTAAAVTGANGGEIDHVELYGVPSTPSAHSRNFVLCPGKSYDRSPCGTGTSAKLACLHADGKLQPGEIWRQESVTGTVFEAFFSRDDRWEDRVVPHITGAAHVIAEATLILDDQDPLCWGIRGRVS